MINALSGSRLWLADEAATLAFGTALAGTLGGGALVFLEGDLGAGKTTLCRGILRGLGFEGAVKSPTYTLVEPYEICGFRVYHFDFYRIGHAEELEFIGLDEMLAEPGLKLVEWPEKAGKLLPAPDVVIRLSVQGDGRRVEVD